MSEVRALNIFPGKGMQPATADGVHINALSVTATGFEYHEIGDREVYAVAPSDDGTLMVITPRGKTNTQGREHAHIGDRALKGIKVDINGQRQLCLSAEGVGALPLDLDKLSQRLSVPAALHSGVLWGFDLGSTAADFINTVTGRRNASLMCVDRTAPRLVGVDQLRSSLGADSQPYSLGNAESLAALHGLQRQSGNSRRQRSAVPMVRYRPNLEVDELGGRGAFAEDCAKRLQIGDVRYRVAAGIVRCVVTNVDEEGTYVGGGLSLLSPRRGRRVTSDGTVEKGLAEPIFCTSLIPELEETGKASVSINAPVEVLEWGKPNVILG